MSYVVICSLLIIKLLSELADEIFLGFAQPELQVKIEAKI